MWSPLKQTTWFLMNPVGQQCAQHVSHSPGIENEEISYDPNLSFMNGAILSAISLLWQVIPFSFFFFYEVGLNHKVIAKLESVSYTYCTVPGTCS